MTSPQDDLPPGTFLLIRENEQETYGQRVVMLDPIPSKDPNEPLNWSTLRKTVNYTIVMASTCVIFTALSVQAIFWQLMVIDLHLSYALLNRTMSVNFVGLAMGCALFIPLAKKYGRRPIYIISMALMLATSFWMSKMNSLAELYVCNLLQGLAGATNEAIVQITVSDLFFVHHRGGMNAIYMTMVMIGSFLTPMAAGYQATIHSWRACYTTMGIFDAILLVLFAFCYEETKYIRVLEGVQTEEPVPGTSTTADAKTVEASSHEDMDLKTAKVTTIQPSTIDHEIDHSIPINPWSKRLALWTPTSEPILPYYYRPWLIMFTFPAVLFTAVQYAVGVAFLTILSSVQAMVFPLPPYLFTPAQVGYLGTGPFIGNLLGSIYGGFVGDRMILYFSRRNKGYYEPEMRLYILLLPALLLCGGIIMFGVSISKGQHWIIACVGGAFFGFGLGGIADAALTLVIDSYRDITGDAFTAVAFIRNAVSIGVPFGIAPWMQHNGLQNMFVTCGFISLIVSATIIPMAVYGKRIRIRTAKWYAEMAAKGKYT